MDPFSLTVGALTLVGTVRLAGKCVDKLRIIRQAPAELKHLLEEAQEVHGLLEQLQRDHDAQNSPKSDDHVPSAPVTSGLARLLERATSKLTELDALIEHHSNQTSKRPIDHGNLGWARGQRKAVKLCDELKVLRLEIIASLGASTSSTVNRVEVAVSRIEVQQNEARVQQAETARLLSTLVTGLALALPSTKPPPFEYAVGDGSLDCNFYCPAPPPGQKPQIQSKSHPHKRSEKMTRRTQQAVKAPETNSMQVYGKKSKVSCKDWCSCVCHQKKVLRIKQPLALGSFSLAASGLPWITPSCDQKSCRSRSVPGIVVTINFPAWFWKRYLTSSFTYTPIRGPNLNFELPRMVGWDCKLWRLGLDGNLGSIRDLFVNGLASPWDVSPLGGSVLHYAAGHKHFKLCKFLVDEGAQTDIEDQFDNSPASLAWDYVLSNQLTEEEAYLVTSTFTDTDFIKTRQFTILHKITLGLIPRTLSSELNHSTKDLDTMDSNGRTCVSWAAARGDLPSLTILLDYGADPNKADSQGYTPLHHVHNIACAELLLSHGADLHARTSTGRTVLHELCHDGGGDTFVDMVAFLVQKGVDIDASDHSGETALMNAVFRRYDACTYYLLYEAGADVARATTGGNTALLYAIMCDAHKPLRDLLGKGADIGIVNGDKQTVLHIAAKNANLATLEILRSHGVENLDAHARDNDGKTASILLAEREEDDDAQQFREKFEELLGSQISVFEDAKEAVVVDEALVGKMASVDVFGKGTTVSTVALVTPTSSDDEDNDDYFDDLTNDDTGLDSSVVFYDAVEDMQPVLPILAA